MEVHILPKYLFILVRSDSKVTHYKSSILETFYLGKG